jgi:signal transduction histidine kinase
MDRVVLQGLAAFRWAAWAWMAVVVLMSRQRLDKPWLAYGLVGLALVVTAAATYVFRARPADALRPGLIAAEVAVGVALVACDGWAYEAGHAFSTSQSLGSVWPLVGVLAAAVAMGPWMGAGIGALMGLARFAATLANGVRDFDGARVLSLTNTAVFYALAGAVAGYVALLLRRAEREISAARAREELARTLHDGVLQTLAVVERRAEDPALARLAREQERELREYLFGTSAAPAAMRDLAGALRAAAARFEQVFGGRVEVLVPDDVPALDAVRLEALTGAVREALTNAGKHGQATKVTVFVDPEEGVFCSVKDNGQGCNPFEIEEGIGISQSIRARMEGVGGRVELAGAVGSGMEVRLWVP